MSNLITLFTRLTVKNMVPNRSISTNSVNWFKVSSCLYAEPLKKKKRIDPQIIKAREDRRRKKLEKQIRRLEKNARQFKPIDELEVPLNLIDERKQRLRTVTFTTEQLESRVLLEKAWAKYKQNQHLADIKMIDRIIQSQQRALDELKLESEELYNEAIHLDTTLLCFTTTGPVNTPKISGYKCPDGDYNDISRKWE